MVGNKFERGCAASCPSYLRRAFRQPAAIDHMDTPLAHGLNGASQSVLRGRALDNVRQRRIGVRPHTAGLVSGDVSRWKVSGGSRMADILSNDQRFLPVVVHAERLDGLRDFSFDDGVNATDFVADFPGDFQSHGPGLGRFLEKVKKG